MSCVCVCAFHRCAICLCEYETGEVLKTIPCQHHFHAECLDKWLAKSRHCPLCTQDIRTATDVHAHDDENMEVRNADDHCVTLGWLSVRRWVAFIRVRACARVFR